MRHLCDTCSSLNVHPEVDNPPGPKKQRLLQSVSDPVYESVTYLAQSAKGIVGKPCHLCALLLRSLKSHQYIGTKEEDTCLPSGPVKVCLSEDDNGVFSIIASCGSVTGHPIQLSLGTG